MVRGGWNVFLTIFCMCLVSEQCIYIIHTCQKNITNYTITVDEQLSSVAAKEIEEHIRIRRYKIVADAINGIQKTFTYVQKIRAHAHPDGNVIIHIVGAQPSVIVNTDYLLTNNKAITYTNRYKKYTCSALPHLYYPGHNPINNQKLIQKVTKKISPEILKKYEVSLFSEQDIHLTLSEKPWMTLRCCLEKFPNEDLLLQSCVACDQEHTQKHETVNADLRFKNQIVVTKKG